MEKISVVVPCYNEEEVLNMFYERLMRVIDSIENRYTYEIIFVNDGSKDSTLNIMKDLRRKNQNIIIINFSRNFGKESAIYAGLKASKGELVVLMDSDLQHPPETILEMLEKIKDGHDVVATKRKNRKRRTCYNKYVLKIILCNNEKIHTNRTRCARL